MALAVRLFFQALNGILAPLECGKSTISGNFYHFDVHDFVICKTFPRDQLPNGAERLIAGFEPPVGVFHEPVFRMSER